MVSMVDMGLGGLGGLGGITDPGAFGGGGGALGDPSGGFGDFGLAGAQGFTMRDPWSDFWGSTPAFQDTFGNFIGDLRQTAPSAFPFEFTETRRRPGEEYFSPKSTHTSGEAFDITNAGLPKHAQVSILDSIARTFPENPEIGPVGSHIHAGLRQAYKDPVDFHAEPVVPDLAQRVRAALGIEDPNAPQVATGVPTPQARPAPPAPIAAQPTTPIAGVPLPVPRPNVGPHASPPPPAVPRPAPRPATPAAAVPTPTPRPMPDVPVPRARPETASERFNQAFPTPEPNPRRGEMDWFQIGSKIFEKMPPPLQRTLTRVAQQLDTSPEAMAYATMATPSLDYRQVTGLNPTTQLGLQYSGLPQAHPGAAWGYSPFGFAQVYEGAPDYVQTAATGPGLFGALGFGWGGLGGLGGMNGGGGGMSNGFSSGGVDIYGGSGSFGGISPGYGGYGGGYGGGIGGPSGTGESGSLGGMF